MSTPLWTSALVAGIVSSTLNAWAGEVASPAASVAVDATKSLGPVGDLYNIGYNGWGDITAPGMTKAFQDFGTKYCRIDLNLRDLCGQKPGDYQWNYIGSPDAGLTFIQRVKQIIVNGWTPLIAFSYHSGAAGLPRWFHGEMNDQKQKGWVRYNLAGSLADDGQGDQITAATQIARDVVSHVASQGLKGLHWETMYEMNPDMPLPKIHHAVARGIREADSRAIIIGPATWPGWSVEEAFARPYLGKYGADLLDKISTHEVPDPTIAREGEWYYIFSSGAGIPVRRSDECPWFDVIVHHTLMANSRDLQVRPLFWSLDGWPLAGELIRETPPRLAEPVTGQWIHQVGWKDVYRIQLRGDGTLTTRSGGKGTWKLEGRNLTMRWMLPGGSQAVDECILSPDGNSYAGKNALDTDIRGWRDQNQPDANP